MAMTLTLISKPYIRKSDASLPLKLSLHTMVTLLASPTLKSYKPCRSNSLDNPAILVHVHPKQTPHISTK